MVFSVHFSGRSEDKIIKKGQKIVCDFLPSQFGRTVQLWHLATAILWREWGNGGGNWSSAFLKVAFVGGGRLLEAIVNRVATLASYSGLSDDFRCVISLDVASRYLGDDDSSATSCFLPRFNRWHVEAVLHRRGSFGLCISYHTATSETTRLPSNVDALSLCMFAFLWVSVEISFDRIFSKCKSDNKLSFRSFDAQRPRGFECFQVRKYASRFLGKFGTLSILHSTPNNGMLIKLDFHKDRVNPRLITSIS
jgi:hypothetical protein